MSAVQKAVFAIATMLLGLSAAPVSAAPRVITVSGTITGLNLPYTPIEHAGFMHNEAFRLRYTYDTEDVDVYYEGEEAFAIFSPGGTLRFSTASASKLWNVDYLELVHVYDYMEDPPIVRLVTFGDEIQVFIDLFATFPQPHSLGSSAATRNYSEFQVLGVNGGCCGTIDLDFDRITVSVPEPATWALMIAGFGFAGTALRRRSALAAS